MADFVPGWSFEAAMAAERRMLVAGRYATVMAPSTTPRPAVSLSHLRSRYLSQGQAGTCWTHSPAQLFSYTAKSLGFDEFPACRRLIGYEGKKLEGGGNPSDGGSPTDAIRVMTDSGVGVAHEGLCEYSDKPGVLGQEPPADVYADAKKSHLQVPITVKSIDQIVALIDGQNGKVPGLPTVNGFQCPGEMQDEGTFLTSISGYLGGHSELITGYIMPGFVDEFMYLELENWWTPIYLPLPPSVAKHVVGYEPTSKARTVTKWVRKDAYLQCCQQGCEHMSATSVSGLAHGTVTPTDTLSALLKGGFVA